jgi:fibronectin type 3 domain-containing protein
MLLFLFLNISHSYAAVLTVTPSGTGQGSINSSPPGIACPGSCTSNFSTFSLFQNPAANSLFTGWGGACLGMENCSLTISSDTVVNSMFELKSSPYKVSGTHYGALQVAYNSVAQNGQILAVAMDQTGDLTIDKPISVTLEGGFDSLFTGNAGNRTKLAGKLSISNGRLTTKNIALALGLPAPPSAPSGVIATSGDSQIILNWATVLGATSYNIYYSTSSGVSRANGTKITGATTGRVITGLTNSTSYYVVVTAENANGEGVESSQVIMSPVAAAVATPPIMGTIPAQGGTVGTPITAIALNSYVTLTNGDPIAIYVITAGSLPPGISFNALTGVIEGTPLSAGSYSTTVKARDKDGASNPAVIPWTIAAPAGPIPPIMVESPEHHGSIGTPITDVNLANYVTLTDGDLITAYAISSGALPPGLALDTATGIISGTPTSDTLSPFGGTYIIQITASDKDGASNSTAVTFVITMPSFDDAPDMSGIPASMTFDERMAALDKVDAQIKLIWVDTLDNNRAALVAYIVSQPEFADAGIAADGTVWARFIDGRPASWLYRSATLPVPAQAPAQILTQDAMQKSASKPALAGAPQAPSTPLKKAVLIDVDGLGKGLPNKIIPWLSEAGFVPFASLGTISDLMTDIKNVSVFHFDTHGLNSENSHGKLGYYLATANHHHPTGLTLDQFYKTELGRLMDEEYLHLATVENYHYWMIGEKFIRTYWSFAADSFFFDDACELFLNPINSMNFLQNLVAMTDKQRLSVVGWDQKVSPDFAANAATLFYELALGRITSNTVLQPPHHRPRSVAAIVPWMKATGRATDPSPPVANMQFYESPGTNDFLLPSIQSLSVIPPSTGTPDWTLEVGSGSLSFGTVPGTLLLNGAPLTVLPGKWTAGQIIATTSAYPSGPVVVKMTDGRASNAVPVTQWTGKIIQNFKDTGYGPVDGTIDCPVVASGDVHYFRGSISEIAKISDNFYVGLTGACTYTLTGSWSDSLNNYTLSGSGTVSPPNATSTSITRFGFASPSGVTALPAAISLNYVMGMGLSGTLRTFNKTTGTELDPPNSPRTVTIQGKSINYSKATLGTDFSISRDQACSGLDTCTETLRLTPAVNTVPAAYTKG